ncbi:hypothetical protein [Mesonia sp. K7]|uniref:hypothetical protein n=1 Tax=Mesonia sp. K7 TaxID=2218606 RepID=UPI000DA9BF40|nr:hypothetical protein [Mesonia sp. K7]PZD76497.1 hypothetical protein DNG35_11805 [Mesonia sp. K7]
MKWLKNIFDFYINSSLHVALSVLSLAVVTVLKFDVQIESRVLVFIFLASVTGYNFVKYAGIARFQHRRLTPNLKIIQVFSLLVFLGLGYVFFLQKIEVILTAISLGIFTAFYAIPFLPGAKNLRSLQSLKIFVIGLVWTGTVVLMPLAGKVDLISKDVLYYFIEIFLLVLVLMFPFEIRDLKFDDENLKTLPQVLGIKKTKILGFVFLTLILAIDFYLFGNSKHQFLITLLVMSLLGVLLLKSKIYQAKYYSSFLVEAIPVLWLILLMSFTN